MQESEGIALPMVIASIDELVDSPVEAAKLRMLSVGEPLEHTIQIHDVKAIENDERGH